MREMDACIIAYLLIGAGFALSAAGRAAFHVPVHRRVKGIEFTASMADLCVGVWLVIAVAITYPSAGRFCRQVWERISR